MSRFPSDDLKAGVKEGKGVISVAEKNYASDEIGSMTD